MANLYEPIDLGDLRLKNRVFMAPLTRNHAKPDGTPGPWAETYYRQRSSAGLIISEATQISPMGKGYINTPGIYQPEHIAGWRGIVNGIHNEGGRIFLQLWHVGQSLTPACCQIMLRRLRLRLSGLAVRRRQRADSWT